MVHPTWFIMHLLRCTHMIKGVCVGNGEGIIGFVSICIFDKSTRRLLLRGECGLRVYILVRDVLLSAVDGIVCSKSKRSRKTIETI